MLRHLLRRYGILPLVIFFTVASVVISLLITTAVSVAAGGTPGITGLSISIVTPVIIAPLFSYQMLALLDQLQRAEDQLRKLAVTDDLTQTHNRRYFIDLAEHALVRARRYGETFALVLFDLDHFKQINDTHGHLAGDEVLRRVSTLGRASLRASDLFARYGGDEFTILLPATSLTQAHEVVDRLRHKLAETRITAQGHTFRCTLTAGIVAFNPHTDTAQTLDALLQRADEALYAAKQGGGNTIVLAPASKPAPSAAAS
jgi:diguanylate cyclase (GGDEF)-like protein